MQPLRLVGEVLTSIAARVGASADASQSAPDDASSGWFLALTSLLVVVAAGGVAARLAGRLTRRSAPELTVLLNQSAAFYRHWPEDRQMTAPAAELMAEAARCQRIIDLLERREAAGVGTGPASRGAIEGLHAWITVLHSQIYSRDDVPSGPAYA